MEWNIIAILLKITSNNIREKHIIHFMGLPVVFFFESLYVYKSFTNCVSKQNYCMPSCHVYLYERVKYQNAELNDWQKNS